MGVKGLLPFLKKCTRPIKIKTFRGYTVAIDAYCWIHRAAYSCAMDLGLGNSTNRSKKEYKEKAAQYLREGNRRAAQECFERCVEVTPEMARAVMKAARRRGVDCIVAPYEADAQLAYLAQAGYVDLIITEDSDLLMFGCKQVICSSF
ncbi:unnamed protein product [Dibothriocephalus latus]|uniref:Exonuclease 1 n=1 Tax=Dibothriocephalus latus TaxID=60516 RepID=A0A3P7QDS0_DIBLA|nr:unnamed protein product [Dibothriocephalus latus]